MNGDEGDYDSWRKLSSKFLNISPSGGNTQNASSMKSIQPEIEPGLAAKQKAILLFQNTGN
jgi:hypothetical protein